LFSSRRIRGDLPEGGRLLRHRLQTPRGGREGGASMAAIAARARAGCRINERVRGTIAGSARDYVSGSERKGGGGLEFVRGSERKKNENARAVFALSSAT